MQAYTLTYFRPYLLIVCGHEVSGAVAAAERSLQCVNVVAFELVPHLNPSCALFLFGDAVGAEIIAES